MGHHLARTDLLGVESTMLFTRMNDIHNVSIFYPLACRSFIIIFNIKIMTQWYPTNTQVNAGSTPYHRYALSDYLIEYAGVFTDIA